MYPIVLIHGFPLDAGMWEGQVEHLRGRGRTVVAPHLPGFGGTEALGFEQTTMEAFAAFVHRVICEQAGGKAIVGGLSMGGYVLLELLREHPEAVAAALLLDTRAEADTAEARAGRLSSIEDVKAKGPASLVESLLKRVVGKKPTEAVRGKVRAMMERQSAEGIIAAQHAMAGRRDNSEVLGELRMPVLIVVGAEDVITPPSVAMAMQSRAGHAMVVQIASAGHLSPMEQPAAVNTAIDAFLATVHEPGGKAS